MKNKKLLLTFVLVLLAMLLAMPLMSACKGAPTPKTLKIGVVAWLGWPIGLEYAHGVEMMADVINKKGGLVIGGDTYTIEPIVYDSKMDNPTAISAVQRLISEDKVKFILQDETSTATPPTTEANKVILIGCTPTPLLYNPDFKYTFQGFTQDTQAPEAWGWFAKNYPNIKTIVESAPDDDIGHSMMDETTKLSELFGPKMIGQIFYSRQATDYSVIATKVKTLNPDAFIPEAGGPAVDSVILKTIWQSGWKGQFFMTGTMSVEAMLSQVPPEVVEGMVATGYDVEFDPALSPAAKEYKDAYIAKNGKWDGPDLAQVNAWYVLIGALQKANSLDVDKVADVLANGLTYDTTNGSPGVMIARPDLGITRTVDTLNCIAIKKLVGGKATLVAKLTKDEAFEYNKAFYGWK